MTEMRLFNEIEIAWKVKALCIVFHCFDPKESFSVLYDESNYATILANAKVIQITSYAM